MPRGLQGGNVHHQRIRRAGVAAAAPGTARQGGRATRRRAVVALVGSLAAAGAAAAEADLPRLLSLQRSDGALLIEFDRAPAVDGAELALWLDRRDVSSLARRDLATRWVLPAAALAMLGAAARVEMWLVRQGTWTLIERRELDAVASPAPMSGDALAPAGSHDAAAAGAPTSPAAPAAGAWRPRLDLALKAQLHAGPSGSEPPPARRSYLDATLRAALDGEQNLGDYQLRGTAQLAAASYRPEALRYATRRDQASAVDLAEYRFDLAGRELALAAGHQAIGNHPLLLERFASRGLSASARGAAGWDLGLAAVNGSSIVGFANPLGLADDEHRIQLVTAARELDPSSPGRARVELSWMDATLRAQVGFDRGAVPDAERLRGLGLRVGTRLADGRARADLAFGRVRYSAAQDSQLALAPAPGAPPTTLVPLADSTRSAWIADLALDVVRAWTPLGERLPVTATVQWRHAEVAPLFKTVGTFLAADQRQDRVGLAFTLGPAQLQLSSERRQDNLDRLPTLLTTRTSNDTLALSLPAALWAAGPDATASDPRSTSPSPWVPSLTVQHVANAQRALDAPDFALTGLAASHRPDQVNRSTQLQAAWSVERAALSVSLQRGRQDNRQPGRENADFELAGWGAQLSVPVGATLNLALGGTRQRNRSVERQLTDTQDGATLGADWRADERWTLAAQLSAQQGRDSAGNASARALAVQTQLTRRIELDAGGIKLPGQWFLRHAWARSERNDHSLGVATDGRLWTLQAGLGLTWGTP